MGATKVILIGGGVAVIAGFAYYKYAQSNFGIQYTGFNITNVSPDYKVIDLNIEFSLSSKAGLIFNVKGMQFNIYANGALVGTGQLPEPINIPANGTIPIVIQSRISLSAITGSLFSTLLNQITGGQPLSILIEGAAQVSVNLPLISFFTLNYPFAQTEALPL